MFDNYQKCDKIFLSWGMFMQKINNIIKNYNELSDEKIDNDSINPIMPAMELIISKIDFDDIEMLSLIDTLKRFESLGLISKINEESLYLLARVIGNEESFYDEDKSYFCLRLQHLLIPFNLNKCYPESEITKDAEIVKHLSEMDIMLNNMSLELNDNDFKLLKKYNEELFNILLCYKSIIKQYENIDVENTNFISDGIIINSTLSHLATMLYFCLEKYDYQYDLLEKVFKNIMNNYQEYLFDCRNYGIYTDSVDLVFNPQNVYNEYVICKDMLDKEHESSKRLIKEK